MLEKLNQYIFKRKAGRFLNQSTRRRHFVDYEHVKTILLLFESDYIEKNRYVHKVISQLTSDGKKVSAWGYVNHKLSTTAILPTFKILDRKSTDLTQCPKDSFKNELMNKEYDMLIDLTLNDVLPLQYVCLYANAGIKIGRSRAIDHILDFAIKLPLSENTEIAGNNTKEIGSEKNSVLNLSETKFQADQKFLFDQIVFYLKNIRCKDLKV